VAATVKQLSEPHRGAAEKTDVSVNVSVYVSVNVSVELSVNVSVDLSVADHVFVATCVFVAAAVSLNFSMAVISAVAASAAGVVCCSVLQCVAVCCSVLQCIVVCCSVLLCVAVCRCCCCPAAGEGRTGSHYIDIKREESQKKGSRYLYFTCGRGNDIDV